MQAQYWSQLIQAPSSIWVQRFFKKLLQSLEHIQSGNVRVETPNGESFYFEGPERGVSAHFVIHDWRTLVLFALKGDIGLTQAYAKCWCDTDNLTQLLLFGMHNEKALSGWLQGKLLSRIASKCLYALRRNSLQGSERNIQAHYDLSNDFYQLWLDSTMTYSAAIFDGSNEPLSTAQNRKYDRLLDRLQARSGSLLEIGCGWGGLADRALQRFDFDITGLTLSKEQLQYAQHRLKNRANIVLRDYRKQQGRFDNIVSIEMFEAVGEAYWPVYFNKIKSLLNPGGRALIQTITIDPAHFERYKNKGDMIRTFIFPGGMLPSIDRFNAQAKQAGLTVTDRMDFGLDYAKTARIWLNNFERSLDSVKQLGFDESFIRIWRFYLAACIAGFEVKRIGVSQLELQHDT